MVATFCLRLALGMLASLVLLSPKQMHPRFFRTQFLTVLGLCIVATLPATDLYQRRLIGLLVAPAFAGAIVWNFEKATLGWVFLVLTAVAIIAILIGVDLQLPSPGLSALASGGSAWPPVLVHTATLLVQLANDVTSAA